MPLLGARLKLGKLRQFIALCFVQIFLFFGLAISDLGSTSALATPLTTEADSYRVEEKTPQPIDLKQASKKANEASEKIFEGKEETKSWMGKTENIDQAIEHGRNEASKKWKSLADKAQRVENSDESLSVPEKKVLENIQGKK